MCFFLHIFENELQLSNTDTCMIHFIRSSSVWEWNIKKQKIFVCGLFIMHQDELLDHWMSIVHHQQLLQRTSPKLLAGF